MAAEGYSVDVSGLVLLVVMLATYMVPTIVAGSRKHHQGGAICVLNLFLGWTFVGWVVALVWACTEVKPAPTHTTAATKTGWCPNCGAQTQPSARFCGGCGGSIA